MSTPASTLRRRLWLCLEITRHRRLSARRNPSFRQNQAAKVFFALGAAVSILYLVFLSVLLAITVGQGMPYSAAGVICGFIPYILVADILFRLMLQNPPALLVKPYLLLPIPRRACIDAFVGASVLSGGNLVTQALVTPYVIMTVVFTAGVLPALMLIVFFWLLSVLGNQLFAIFRITFNGHFLWVLLPLALAAMVFAPAFVGQHASFEQLYDFYSTIGDSMAAGNPLPLLALLGILIGAIAANREIQFRAIVSELSHHHRQQSTVTRRSTGFLGSNSMTGCYRQLIANTYIRCKNPRKSLVTSIILVLVFSLLSAYTTVYDESGSANFWCLYNYLLFAIILSSTITAYEGNYFDFLAVHRENILTMLKAKYQLFCLLQLLPFLVMLIPVIAGKWSLFMVVTCCIFTCGPVYCLSFQMAVYNKQTMPLNATIAGGRQQNSYLNIVISIATFGLPFALNALLVAVCSEQLAYDIELCLGLFFILTHNLWLRNVYHRMAKRRYILLEGFRDSKM